MTTKVTLANYLHPRIFPQCSDMMHYIIGEIIGEKWVETDRARPGDGFTVTADGYVLNEGLFISGYDDFLRNVAGYVEAADMPPDMVAEFWRRYAEKVDLTFYAPAEV
jgi:hypothetical protein